MSRAGTFRLGLLLTALLAPMAVAEAAGQGRSFPNAPASLKPAGAGMHQQRLSRSAWIRHDGARDHAGRHWRRSGRGLFSSAGYLGPWAYPASPSSSHGLPSDGDAPQRGIDRNSFEHMPVRMGIVRAPTPEPTLYRLEGRPDRPATRVIRINDPEPRQGRSRFAHAETGALLLIVPRR